jgi:hypothetical protein
MVKPDWKAFVDYSYMDKTIKNSLKDTDNTDTILGVVYASNESPWEFRTEYDVDKENDLKPWNEDLNPWGIRIAYKINSSAKVQVESKKASPAGTDKVTEVKLNICF